MDKKTKQILMVAGGAFLVYMLFFRKKADETVVVAPVDTGNGNGDGDPAESSSFSRASGSMCDDYFSSGETYPPDTSVNGGFANGGTGGQGSGPNGVVTRADCLNGYYGSTGGPTRPPLSRMRRVRRSR